MENLEKNTSRNNPVQRVLYADDEPQLRSLFLTVMTDNGYQVDLAEDGWQALDLFAANIYDLVVLDHKMSGLLGLEVASKLKAVAPDLPVVILTGAGGEALAAEALKVGIDQYIVKNNTNTYIHEMPMVVDRLIEERDKKNLVAAAEKTLFESEARYRELVELSPDAIVVVRDGVISLANRRAMEIYNCRDDDQLVGSVLLDRIASDQKVLAKEVFCQVTDENTPVFNIEQQHVRKDGSMIDVELNGAPVSGMNEGQAVFVIRDVSERNELRARVADIERHQAVGQLTAGVAHEFNNILQVVLGVNEFLEGELDDPSRIAPATAAIKKGAELTRQLLAYSRDQFLNPKSVDLGGFLESTLKPITGKMDNCIKITNLVEVGAVQINVDRSSFRQSIINLCDNAACAMPDGGTLRIETEKNAVPGGQFIYGKEIMAGNYVTLKISDNGLGMPANVLKRSFEPFFTTRDVGQGTGLGLSLVFGFTQQSGGYAAISSVQGEGTEVRMSFPVDAERE